MGEQQRLVKRRATSGHPRRRGGAGDRGKTGIGEGEGDKTRAGGRDGNAEAFSDLVGAARCPHLGNRFTARGDDQMGGADFGAGVGRGQRHRIAAVGFGDVTQRALQTQIYMRLIHQPSQHGDDFLGRCVTEQLAKGLFVPCNAMGVDEFDKIPLGIFRQCRFGEMRVGADESISSAMHVGEIATPAAGNADLFTGGLGVIDQQHAPARIGRAHHAGSPGAKDHGIILHVPRFA